MKNQVDKWQQINIYYIVNICVEPLVKNYDITHIRHEKLSVKALYRLS